MTPSPPPSNTTVILGPFNTIAIKPNTIVRLKGVQGVTRPIDILNQGPGNIYIRADADPSSTDPSSLQVPANWAVNHLATDPNTGLGVCSDANTTISVNVT